MPTESAPLLMDGGTYRLSRGGPALRGPIPPLRGVERDGREFGFEQRPVIALKTTASLQTRMHQRAAI